MRDSSVQKKCSNDVLVALVGCPNVGKSTLFNALTGCNQHTGNWPGKTVAVAQGSCQYKGKRYIYVDLPGTYSMASQSPDEQVTTEFISSCAADCTIVVVDATSLERTLQLVLQVMELKQRMMVCVNLMDEAVRKGIEIDLDCLERELGVPVVGISAGTGDGIDRVREKLRNLSDGFLTLHPKCVLQEKKCTWLCGSDEESDWMTVVLQSRAREIADCVIKGDTSWRPSRLDRIVLGRHSAYLVMGLLLLLIFWLTIRAAGVPSELLQRFFIWGRVALEPMTLRWPSWVTSLIMDGIYDTVSCVISVMLPPLLIFFPLFSFLEDLGYLPRAAFLLDHLFYTCGSCGKQALTMAMGFGCNAAGVTGARIISSEKERLIAVITNALVPCNGKFPTLIALIGLFFSDTVWMGTLVLSAFILLSVVVTLICSKLLSVTMIRGKSANLLLELPPYRRPNVKTILSKALVDRVCAVLLRAVMVSVPAGVIIWLMGNVSVRGVTLVHHLIGWLDPIGRFLGLDGVIMTAFLFSFPANELFLPSVVSLLDVQGVSMMELLTSYGWSKSTALCTLLFLLFHWPCGTTCLTIRKETGSWKWTIVAVLLPLLVGVLLCFLLKAL